MSSCSNDDDLGKELEGFNRKALLENTVDYVIIPQIYQFDKQLNMLKVVVEQFTMNPTLLNLELAKKQWVRLMKEWKDCELHNYGKINESFIYDKLDTWPSNSNFIERFISSNDSIDENYISFKGTSSKGLPSIEYFLFGETGNSLTVLDSFMLSPVSRRRKQYLNATVADAITQSHNLLSLWRNDYRNSFIEGDGNNLKGSINLLVNQMTFLSENVLKTKLGKPMGKNNGLAPDSSLLEARASKQSLSHIKRNVLSLKNAFHCLDTNNNNLVGVDDYLTHTLGNEELTERIRNQFNVLDVSLNQINESLATALINQPQELENAYQELKKLLILIKVDMSSSLSILITFNDNDGD
ncbi:MAG: imelysin family protein [Flavobacteriales bacterium]|nr:imelysin family protein [Flavobacteriales bacterium]